MRWNFLCLRNCVSDLKEFCFDQNKFTGQVFEAPATMSTGIIVVTDVTLFKTYVDVSEELVVSILTVE